MSPVDIGIIAFGLFAGYWVVSKFFFKTSDGAAKSSQAGPFSAAGSSTSGPTPPPSPKTPTPPAWHEVLRVSPMASVEEIRTAYRELISQYHPDKVDSLGVEIKELAARKASEITVAYQAGLKARGAPA